MPSSKTKPKKASEMAADIKRHYVPFVKMHYSHYYRTYSILFPQPLYSLQFHHLPRPYERIPNIYVDVGDPVNVAMRWTQQRRVQHPSSPPVLFVCAANDKRPGGDWETGVAGYEERLCRRSNLSATLATPAAAVGMATGAGTATNTTSNYPIPIEGGILCEDVVVFGPERSGCHDKLPPVPQPPSPTPPWDAVAVCAVPPVRWPKLTAGGTQYSFAAERDMVKRKMRAALAIAVHQGYAEVVVGGDFGLGNGYRNPPRETALLWREVLLWDQELRGRLAAVAFVFEDPALSTAQAIREHQARREGAGGSGGGGGGGSGSGSGSRGGGSSRGSGGNSSRGSGGSSSSRKRESVGSSRSSSHGSAESTPTSPAGLAAPPAESDYAIFKTIFDSDEVARALRQPDPRYELGTLMSPA